MCRRPECRGGVEWPDECREPCAWPWIAHLLRRTPDNMAMPCSVKARGSLASCDRHKMNFHTPLQCGGESTQHGKRMSFILGVFESADSGSSRPHQLGQLPLCKTGTQAEGYELSGHSIGRSCRL